MAEELQDDKDSSKKNLLLEVFIPEELTPVIKDLPKEKQKEIINAISSISVKKQSSSFRGPLPHPSIYFFAGEDRFSIVRTFYLLSFSGTRS